MRILYTYEDQTSHCIRDCNGELGGTTGLVGCANGADTLKPTPVPCEDSLSNTVGDSVTSIRNAINNTPQMDSVRNNVGNKYEVGFTVQRTCQFPPTCTYVPWHYKGNGAAHFVDLDLSSGSIADMHFHPVEDSAGNHNVQSHSAVDIWGLIERWDYPPNYRFTTRFVYPGDTSLHTEFAIAIADTNLIRQFINSHPDVNTVIDMRDSIMKNGVMIRNPQKASWAGDKTITNSPYDVYIDTYYKISNQNFEQKYWETYAGIYMMNSFFNMGVNFYKKVDGQFKRVKVEDDPNNPCKLKVTICE